MSNLPKIYAHCKAGCAWETVHRSEFEQSAAFIEAEKTDGAYELEIGKEYKVIAPVNADFQFEDNICIPYKDTDDELLIIEKENTDKYATSYVVRFLEIQDYFAVYEFAGVRYRVETAKRLKPNPFVMGEGIKCYLHNTEATLEVKPTSVTDTYLTPEKHLMVVLSNGEEIDAGCILRNVSFAISVKGGVHGSDTYNVEGEVIEGTTWSEWCRDYNKTNYPHNNNTDIWINREGYVYHTMYGVYLADSNGNKVKWTDKIIGDTYSNYVAPTDPDEPDEPETPTETVSFNISVHTDISDYTVTDTAPKGTTWGEWCSGVNENAPVAVWENREGYVYNDMSPTFYLADSNNNKVKWTDEIVSGDYTDYKETPIEPDEPTDDEVVAFSIIQSTGPEQYYTDYARVAKGTTWAQWCEYINSNLDPMFIENVGLMWSNDNGYVFNPCYGFYLKDSNGNNIPWDSEIVGGNYTNFRVDNNVLFAMEYAGNVINTETIGILEGYENEWAYWCTQHNTQQGGEEIWANNNGYIYHNMLGFYLTDINGNKVPWSALIVNGGYYLVDVTIQPVFDPETMSITFTLPNGESYTTKKGTTFEQFANARPDVLAQGSGSTFVTMSNGEIVGIDGENCIYTDVIIDGGTYMGMGA